jgi:hypothetical protein
MQQPGLEVARARTDCSPGRDWHYLASTVNSVEARRSSETVSMEPLWADRAATEADLDAKTLRIEPPSTPAVVDNEAFQMSQGNLGFAEHKSSIVFHEASLSRVDLRKKHPHLWQQVLNWRLLACQA